MSAPRIYEDWTGNIVNGADLRNLDPGAIRAARAAFSERFPDRSEEASGWDDATFLSRAGVLKRGKVTVAALILLGKAGDRMLPQSVCIRWRLIDTDGAEVDSRTFDGPALLASTHAVSMVRNWSVRTGAGDSESVVSAYRTSSLLEAVRNAVVHQDYGLGGTIELVERENESVTVVSQGTFPERSPESFVTGPPLGAPRRNAFLYGAMAGLGVIPASGSGIRSMYLSQAYRRFPMPDFDILGDRVAVRFSGIRGGSYARVLDLRGDLDLRTVMDLDRIAKNRFVADRRIKALARRGLVEILGGLPCIASGAGQEVVALGGVVDQIAELEGARRGPLLAVEADEQFAGGHQALAEPYGGLVREALYGAVAPQIEREGPLVARRGLPVGGGVGVEGGRGGVFVRFTAGLDQTPGLFGQTDALLRGGTDLSGQEGGGFQRAVAEGERFVVEGRGRGRLAPVCGVANLVTGVEVGHSVLPVGIPAEALRHRGDMHAAFVVLADNEARRARPVVVGRDVAEGRVEA